MKGLLKIRSRQQNFVKFHNTEDNTRHHAEADVKVAAHADNVLREDVELGRRDALPLALHTAALDDLILILRGVTGSR